MKRVLTVLIMVVMAMQIFTACGREKKRALSTEELVVLVENYVDMECQQHGHITIVSHDDTTVEFNVVDVIDSDGMYWIFWDAKTSISLMQREVSH